MPKRQAVPRSEAAPLGDALDLAIARHGTRTGAARRLAALGATASGAGEPDEDEEDSHPGPRQEPQETRLSRISKLSTRRPDAAPDGQFTPAAAGEPGTAAFRGTGAPPDGGTAAKDGGEPGSGGDAPRKRTGRRVRPLLVAGAASVSVLITVVVLMAGSGDGSEDGAPKDDTGLADLVASGPDNPPAVPPALDGTPSDTADVEQGDETPTKDGDEEGESPVPPDAREPEADASGAADEDETGENANAADGTPAYQVAALPSPGQWESQRHRLTHAQTGDCLAREGDRGVAQGACDPVWRRYSVDDGTYLLKHVQANKCLDTNGTGAYLSDCTTKDSGQIWHLQVADGCAVTLASVPYDKYVTGRSGGRVEPASAGSAGHRAAYTWRAPSLLDGC
ncbi:hypothetical protein ABTZ58_23640 [Streptomyces sp. NPDC094143]|uniref:hypothetical protein n=1 Tax=Streptomyces sp. NPDC094143 TaxID=3155310 RepID=UPI003322FA1D